MENVLPKNVLKNIKGNEIPKKWSSNLHLDSNQDYELTIIVKPMREEKKKIQQGRWAKVAERASNDNRLGGISEEVLGIGKGFRESFDLNDSFSTE